MDQSNEEATDLPNRNGFIAVYSLMALSPLASLALRSPAVARTFTGECSGDCATCGCSPERSASHTCCCWIRKMREQESRTGTSPCCLAGERKLT